jgi:isoleucyl-tRNA synthetase
VRRSRRRFYGKGWPVDKRTAYATLYEVLTTLNRVVAPIIPFMSERVYQNLVAGHDADAPRSVHHLPFPEADESLIDELLSAQVEIVMRVVSLGRAARKDSQVKVRQPMRRMIVGSHLASVVGAVEAFKDHLVEELNVKEIEVCPFILDEWFTTKMEPNKALVFQTFGNKGRAVIDAIMSADPNVVADGLHSSPTHEFCLEIDGESIRLSKSFFRFSIQYNPGFAGAFLATDSGNTIVLLDKKVTPQLKNEGIAREIIRNVQNLRKEANLDIADRIKLSLRTESPEIRAAIDQCAEYIKTETLAVESRASQLTEATTTAEVKIDGETVGISLERA